MFTAIKSPWKIANYLHMRLITPVALIFFRIMRVKIGPNARFYGLPIIQKTHGSQMTIGYGAQMRSTKWSNPLAPYHPVILSTRKSNAVIQIGHHFSMTGGSIIADEQIIIGNFVTVGANCRIFDTDFHPVDAEKRRLHPKDAMTAPVIIEDDVFIGTDTLILKGVNIGAGTVIGAGSVVTRSIPPNVIAAGNPASVIKSNLPGEVNIP